jgi:hypothetical protein
VAGQARLHSQAGHYGLTPDEYQRHENAQRDKSWTAAGIDIDAVIEQVCAFDRYIGASLLRIGLRRKESVMFRPHRCVVPFEATGLPSEERQADSYVRIKEGAKGRRLRFVPLDSAERVAALRFAQVLTKNEDAHMGDPGHSLDRNLRRFDYVMGASAHQGRTGSHVARPATRSPDRPLQRESGGCARCAAEVTCPPTWMRRPDSRLPVWRGHNRPRASGAYLGGLLARQAQRKVPPPDTGPNLPGDEGMPEDR